MSLSHVESVACPAAAAVHLNQIEAPPASPAWSGSPCSFVASTLLPETKAVRALQSLRGGEVVIVRRRASRDAGRR